jgi:hypothetical protein
MDAPTRQQRRVKPRANRIVVFASAALLALALAGGIVSSAQSDISNYASAVLRDTPNGYWHLGETDATQPATDASPNGNNGTYAGNLTFSLPGFDPTESAVGVAPGVSGGADGSITIPAPAGGTLDPGSSDFSIEGWVQTTSTAPGQVVAAEATAGSNGCLASPGWVLSITSAGLAEFEMDTGAVAPSGADCTSPEQVIAQSSPIAPPLNDGGWHYLVISLCRSCSPASATIWVDGISQVTNPTASFETLSTGDPLQFGLGINGSSQYQTLAGALDELAYYPYALTDAQVQAHDKAAFASGVGGGGGCPGCKPYLPPEPHVTTSLYVCNNNTTTAYGDGKSRGTADAATPTQNSVVVLGFGGQNSSNTGTVWISGCSGGSTYAQIAAWAESYGQGWYNGARAAGDKSSTLILAVGTNNDLSQVSSSGGQTWARSAVNPAKTWIQKNGYASQVVIWGADDLEQGYSSATNARAWAVGYSGTGIAPYINFGGTSGCPLSGTTYSNGGCSNSWHQADVYYLSWGNPAAYATPEVYANSGCATQPAQWTLISRYGYYNQPTGKIHFEGPMSEQGLSGACSESQAWTSLYNALNTTLVTPAGPAGITSSTNTFLYQTNI